MLPYVPKKLVPLFSFGYETIVGREIKSMRANARFASCSWVAAKGKAWRLATNNRIASVFPCVCAALTLVSDNDIVAVDFSDFKDGKQVLMFAKQTKKGRALPLYFETLEYPIEKDSQNLFVIETIRNFFEAVGCTPMLVFDRGFACPSIIKFLAQHQYCFIIRIKKRKFLATVVRGETTAAEDVAKNDASVYAYGCMLRLIVSDDPKNGNDPWYLITNDGDATREEIITRYYHRFEIEEFFRDAKRLLGLECVSFKSIRSLEVILWFAILTCWLFEKIAETITEAEERERQSWRVSLFRYVLEKLQHEILHLADPPSERMAEGG